MRRYLFINILLVVAGILLAPALFGAGAVWKGKMQPRRPSVSAPATEKDRSLARKKLNSEESMPDRENVASTPAVSAVVINGHALSPQQLQESASNYGVTPPPGRYWYDTISGKWGDEGGRREAVGFIRPGHAFGSLSPRKQQLVGERLCDQRGRFPTALRHESNASGSSIHSSAHGDAANF